MCAKLEPSASPTVVSRPTIVLPVITSWTKFDIDAVTCVLYSPIQASQELIFLNAGKNMEQSTTGQSSSARVNTYVCTYNAHSAAVTPLYKQTYNGVKLKRTFTPHVSNHKGIEVSKTKLGADHPSTLTSMNSVAFTLKGQGNSDEAIRLMQDCYTLQVEVLGPQYPYTVSSHDTLTAWRLEDVTLSK